MDTTKTFVYFKNTAENTKGFCTFLLKYKTAYSCG